MHAPHVHNTKSHAALVVNKSVFISHVAAPLHYPDYLIKHGLSEDMLIQLLSNDCDLLWEIPNTCPSNTFYFHLHPFLKIWDRTRYCTKTFLGTFYAKIDPYLKERNYRPDNAFRFVERMVNRFQHVRASDIPDRQLSAYSDSDIGVDQSPLENCYPPDVTTIWSPKPCGGNLQTSHPERQENHKKCQIQSIQDQLKEKDSEMRALKHLAHKKDKTASKLQNKVLTVTSELRSASATIKKIEHEKDVCKRKTRKMEVLLDNVQEDFLVSEDTIETLQEENKELMENIISLKSMLDN